MHRWRLHLVGIDSDESRKAIKRNIEKLRKETTLSERAVIMRELKNEIKEYVDGSRQPTPETPYLKTHKEQVKKYENIREYVHLHGKMKPTYETIDALYERYMYELAQIIVSEYYLPIEADASIPSYFENFFSTLTKYYNESLPY